MAIDFVGLEQAAQASAAVSTPCSCDQAHLLAWQQVPLTLELDQFEEVASLVEDPFAEPTFAEYHPAGTRLESDDAPIAPRYYPANRSHLLRCVKCGRHYLRYTEAGGYFSEFRIRALRPELLVDATV
ncbi:hypothetical protein GJ699_05010 [Duganella sp. FT80W]|uniref:Uncharacterized protein n=1 Tax=Duganella guangzhouensis TaxID=2666084 RepID=A0A6I2KYQ3_9BURK|nr:hypothetical protein [Duganella guangzhouensis]MRW89336.1 hypothetical protein [Duganella guangzhouensis]